MDDTEKLTALKRAYADIILNTAKEAAGRILASERKALRYERELLTTKEEALQMLLRLKQTLDSKIIEMDKVSSSQQRKIDALEAQLQEAEDIVRDLRVELSEVQAELEKTKQNQAPPAMDEQNLDGDTSHENGISSRNDQARSLLEQNLESTTTHEKGLYSADFIVSQPNSQVEPETNSGTSKMLNGMFEGLCYRTDDSHMDHCYNDNPNFSSLVKRRKEPELYKNGCTQRIRASERNMLDGYLSISKLNDDAENGSFIGRDNDGKRIHLTSTSKNETDQAQENQYEPRVAQIDYSHVLKIPLKSFRNKRKRAARYEKTKVLQCKNLHHNEGRENFQKVCPTLNDENQLVNSCEKMPGEVLKETPSAPSQKLGIELSTESGCAKATENLAEFVKPCSLQKVTKEDKVAINKSNLISQESLLAKFEVPACKIDFKKDDESESKLNAKVSDLEDVVASPPASSRLFKYTFQRKRKRDALSSPEQNSSLKESTAEKQNGSSEPESSSLLTESPRDSRRLAQVARQSFHARTVIENKREMGIASKAGDWAFKAFTASLGVATVYLTATFSVNVYKGLAWHKAQSTYKDTTLSLYVFRSKR
ncbi:hypothetical protein G4B88_025203 [Cannabis sativa]|uniref:Uncharacterized protein n=2 Tax=Cannabis sativa TaxID=3483 RepID=A0A7J6G025_CANSA|nr:hypothetical protein G4B88_025203 [Cannabis sativa]